jgi:hypothetical protein
LLPSFAKSRIIEDIQVTRGEIKEFSAPAYAIAAPDFKGYKFKSDRIKPLADTFTRMCKPHSGDNLVTGIEKAFKPMLANLDEIEKLIEQVYGDDVGGATLTYQKANLLQLVEIIGFVSRYARKLLIYVYAAETEKYPEAGTVFTDSIVPAEIEWITSNLVSFCTAFNIVMMKPEELKKHLTDIPDIVVKQETAQAVSATIGDKKLDPFNMKLIPVWLNPIYHVRMFVAEWQTNRYHEAKAELQLLQLHRLHLEKLREGKPDARLKQEIEYVENRINKLSYKLKEMEKSNGQ